MNFGTKELEALLLKVTGISIQEYNSLFAEAEALDLEKKDKVSLILVSESGKVSRDIYNSLSTVGGISQSFYKDYGTNYQMEFYSAVGIECEIQAA